MADSNTVPKARCVSEHARFRDRVDMVALPGGHRAWVVGGYDDVARLLADSRLALNKVRSRDGYKGFSLPPSLDANLLNMDGADHTRVRALAAPAFTRRSVAQLDAMVTDVATHQVNTLTADGPVDLLADVCVPVPATVIGRLLGVPSSVFAPLRDAATAMVCFDAESPDSLRRLVTAVGFLTDTFERLVGDKRGSGIDDGLISEWVRAVDGDSSLSDEEVVSLAFLLMLAGLENTAHLLGNVFAALLSAPEQPQAAWSCRRQALMEQANPAPFAIRRFAIEDVPVGDTVVPAGATVLLSLAAADTDPQRGKRPSLMFGRGPHYCLGARISEAMIDAVVNAFTARWPHARLAETVDDLAYRDSWRTHGLVSLPVVLDTGTLA
ncbi:cytochrome P450 [Nocardia sp. CNY236]|uniref:cytochrome P450 n=1 Tax=Nocardia sp. CNY236 TaxID=1169152 RepID=UPI000422A05C|nr:cytochrome P450 [Nocardia sp. CNY236]